MNLIYLWLEGTLSNVLIFQDSVLSDRRTLVIDLVVQKGKIENEIKNIVDRINSLVVILAKYYQLVCSS